MVPIPLDMGLAMVMAATARGLQTPRLMPTMATEAMVDMGLATPLATVVLAMAMARGLLMPSLTMDTVELTPDTDMVDTDLVLAMATASKQLSNGSYPDLPRLMQGTATTNIC